MVARQSSSVVIEKGKKIERGRRGIAIPSESQVLGEMRELVGERMNEGIQDGRIRSRDEVDEGLSWYLDRIAIGVNEKRRNNGVSERVQEGAYEGLVGDECVERILSMIHRV